MIFSQSRYYVQCDYCGFEVASPTEVDDAMYVVIPDEWVIEREAIIDPLPDYLKEIVLGIAPRDAHFCCEQHRQAWKALGVVSSVAGCFPPMPPPPTDPNQGDT